MNEQILINPSGKELEIRTGAAAPIEKVLSVTLEGTIGSVLDFASKRDSLITKEFAHVIINRKQMSVKLVVGERREWKRYTVSGKMILHEYLTDLGINESKQYYISDLIRVFKLNRRYFATRADHIAMLDKLMSFSAKIETEIVAKNDLKGSAANSIISKITHDIPLSFKMHIPVFEGEKKDTFDVTVEVYHENGHVVCSLVSVELAEAIEKTVEETMEKVKTELKDYVQIIQ